MLGQAVHGSAAGRVSPTLVLRSEAARTRSQSGRDCSSVQGKFPGLSGSGSRAEAKRKANNRNLERLRGGRVGGKRSAQQRQRQGDGESATGMSQVMENRTEIKNLPLANKPRQEGHKKTLKDKTETNKHLSLESPQKHTTVGLSGVKDWRGDSARKQAEETDTDQTPESTQRANSDISPLCSIMQRETSQRPPSVVKGVLGEDFSPVSNNPLFSVTTDFQLAHPKERAADVIGRSSSPV